MKFNGIKENMQLLIEHPSWDPSVLPWDLKTIFDCELSIDDVQTLECGVTVQIGECELTLKKVETV